MYRFVIILFTLFLVACSGNSDKGEILASVGDKELYHADLNHLFAHNRYSYDDSVTLVKQFINDWIEEQILVQEAENSKKINFDIVEQRVANFRNDLIVHELENVLLNERLDTNVTDEEIKKYYQQNQKEFQLNDYLVKVLYLKLPFDAPDIEKVGQLYKLSKEADLQELQEYAKVYASNFYYDAENWIYFDDILKEVPLQDINKDKFILKRSKIRFEEGGFYYFLNVIDYKLKNSISPLSFEQNKIKDRIINIRIRTLREEIRKEIITNAYANDRIKIYQ